MLNRSNSSSFDHLRAIALAAAVTAVGLLGAGTAAADGTSNWTVTTNIVSSKLKIIVASTTATGGGCSHANDLQSPDMHTCQKDTVKFMAPHSGDTIVVFASGYIFAGANANDPDVDMLTDVGSITATISANDGNYRYYVAVLDSGALYASDPKMLVGTATSTLGDIASRLADLRKQYPKERSRINKLIREVNALKQRLGVN